MKRGGIYRTNLAKKKNVNMLNYEYIPDQSSLSLSDESFDHQSFLSYMNSQNSLFDLLQSSVNINMPKDKYFYEIPNIYTAMKQVPQDWNRNTLRPLNPTNIDKRFSIDRSNRYPGYQGLTPLNGKNIHLCNGRNMIYASQGAGKLYSDYQRPYQKSDLDGRMYNIDKSMLKRRFERFDLKTSGSRYDAYLTGLMPVTASNHNLHENVYLGESYRSMDFGVRPFIKSANCKIGYKDNKGRIVSCHHEDVVNPELDTVEVTKPKEMKKIKSHKSYFSNSSENKFYQKNDSLDMSNKECDCSLDCGFSRLFS